jgi:trk system potassium uptake protein TrkA
VKIVILGCGRVGAALASKMDREGHEVTVIDGSSEAFNRLDVGFQGETIVGNGVDEDILRRAGIETADAFAAVTNIDNRNIMASQITKYIFQVKKVVCRIYDPMRSETYRDLGLEVFSSTSVIAQMFFEAFVGKTSE